MTALVVLCVAAGGAVGAPLRYLVDRYVADQVESDFPWGTFAVNISGSFVLGALTGLAIEGHLNPELGALLGTGLCGAYTTFSSWTYETARLFEEGDVLQGVANAGASLVVGLLAAGAGIAAGIGMSRAF